jgi:transglutaminase-like putative cysteine protease
MLGDYNSGTIPYVLGELPSGVPGVKATLRLMVDLVREYKTDPALVRFAGDLLQRCQIPEKNPRAEVKCLQNWVRDNIRYVRDVRDVETLRTPPEVLRGRTGDCDDKALLLATLLEAVGYRTKFGAIGVRGGGYSHVLTFVVLGRGPVPLETILPGVEPGWFPPDATSIMWASV